MNQQMIGTMKFNINLQAVFLDRDGTIGGTGHFIHPKDFELYPYVSEAITALKDLGIKVFAITNQYRISMGQATEEEFYNQFIEFGFDDAYICPHSRDIDCDCRKPAAGMMIRAAKEYNLDLTQCAVIGDVGDSDMLAADKVGAIKILVRTGFGEGSLKEFRNTWIGVEADYIAENVLDAVNWLLASQTNR